MTNAGRVNCALEKTNQNLSDEICRLKVISVVVLRWIQRCFATVYFHALVQEEIDSDKKKILQLQKQVKRRYADDCST